MKILDEGDPWEAPNTKQTLKIADYLIESVHEQLINVNSAVFNLQFYQAF